MKIINNNENKKININIKIIISFIIILLVFIILFFNIKNRKNNLDKGREIAVVDGFTVYESDIQNRLDTISPNAKINIESLPTDILKAIVLEVSVNNQIDKKAKKLNYQNDQEINKKVQEYKKELVREKFLNEQIYSKITEKEALNEYQKIIDNLNGKEERKIKHILTSDEDEIERARRSVMRSGNFEKVAKEKSIDTASAENGGSIGYVLKEELVPEFGNIAFILKVGEISKPVKTQYGWHIIKVEDVRPAKFLPFKEVKDGIVHRLQQQAIQDYLISLTKDANIDIKVSTKQENVPNNKLEDKNIEINSIKEEISEE